MVAAVLALASSISWGLSDFLGGVQSRRNALLAVLVLSQGLAFVILVAAVGLGAPTEHDTTATLLAAGSGTFGMLALAAFYHALTIGTMSIVAPISATGTAIPVLVGLASGEKPSAVQIAGIVLAGRRRRARRARGAVGGRRRRARQPQGDRARAVRRGRLRHVLRRRSTGRRRPPTSPGCCSPRARPTWWCCSCAAPCCARRCRATARLAAARSPRSACSTSGEPALRARGGPRAAQRRRRARLALPRRDGDPRAVVLDERLSRAQAPGRAHNLGGRRRARRRLRTSTATARRRAGSDCLMPDDCSRPCSASLALLAAPAARRPAAPDQVMTFEAPDELLSDADARPDAERDPEHAA